MAAASTAIQRDPLELCTPSASSSFSCSSAASEGDLRVQKVDVEISEVSLACKLPAWLNGKPSPAEVAAPGALIARNTV